jgi:hypothetical protein
MQGHYRAKAQSGISPVPAWRLSRNLPIRPGKALQVTITLPNEQRIEVAEAVMQWSRRQEFAVENLL